MTSNESLYELRHEVDYVIGSPAEIPADGAPYDEIVPSFFERDSFYTSIVEKYHKSVKGNLPLSVMKMSEMDHVAQATAQALQSVKANLGDNYADLTSLVHYGYLGNSKKYDPDYNFFFDAGNFMQRYASKADYQQWKQALDKAVVMKRIGYSWDTSCRWVYFYTNFEMTEEKFHGVSMFIPQDPMKAKYAKWNEDIKQMEWYQSSSSL